MRFNDLSQLKRPKPLEIILGTLPQHILMAEYAMNKAFKICELVGVIFSESYEWYGFTLADKAQPEFIADIGLPANDLNLRDHTTLGSGSIAEFQESLPEDVIINGWIHSHGDLQYKHFSNTDEKNHRTVLDFVAARTRKPLAKKEITIQDLVILEKGQFAEEDLARGSVSLIADGPITEARILETIYGNFCFSIVVGDEGWHEQAIHYEERGILSGYASVSSNAARIELVDTGRALEKIDLDALHEEVEKKLQPQLNPSLETMERM
jgi:hypothetical protein